MGSVKTKNPSVKYQGAERSPVKLPFYLVGFQELTDFLHVLDLLLVEQIKLVLAALEFISPSVDAFLKLLQAILDGVPLCFW